jgi:hypothetical protein
MQLPIAAYKTIFQLNSAASCVHPTRDIALTSTPKNHLNSCPFLQLPLAMNPSKRQRAVRQQLVLSSALVGHIASFISDGQSLACTSAVCRAWRALPLDPLFKAVYKHVFEVESLAHASIAEQTTWRERYRVRNETEAMWRCGRGVVETRIDTPNMSVQLKHIACNEHNVVYCFVCTVRDEPVQTRHLPLSCDGQSVPTEGWS